MNEKVDYTGQKFQMLTIIGDGDGIYEGKKKVRSVLCLCDCGKYKDIHLKSLRKGKIKSCGCYIKPLEEYIIGTVFNNWTLLEEVPYSKSGRKALFKCACGTEAVKFYVNVKSGKNKSCGCLPKPKKKPLDIKPLELPIKIENTDWTIISESAERNLKGGIIRTVGVQCSCGEIEVKKYVEVKRTEKCLKCRKQDTIDNINPVVVKLKTRRVSMKSRCYSKTNPDYKNYGGRGIKVCDEWLESFESFYQWSINNGYREGLELDRIDNDGDYSPENCAYITKSENLMKMDCVNLTVEDILFIRSDKFDLHMCDLHGYKRNVAKNIIDGKTFKDII